MRSRFKAEHVDDLGERGIRLRCIGDHDSTGRADRHEHEVDDGPNDRAVRQNIAPSIGVARMGFFHQVWLDEHEFTARHETPEGIPSRSSEPLLVQAGIREGLPDCPVHGVTLLGDGLEPVLRVPTARVKGSLIGVHSLVGHDEHDVLRADHPPMIAKIKVLRKVEG